VQNVRTLAVPSLLDRSSEEEEKPPPLSLSFDSLSSLLA
jgi:hypothetical protein